MNETLKTIHNLATTHGFFTERPVKPEDLEAVVQASLRAANASSRQSYSIVTVEDRQTVRQLCGYNGMASIVYCVDFNRIEDMAAYLGEKHEVNGLMDFITGSTDTILAAQTGAIAAQSLGLDMMFTNGIHRGDLSRVYRLLGLPGKYCVPLIMLVLGYGEHAKEPRGRLNGQGVVHRGKYARLTKEGAEEILALYGDKENRLGMADYWGSEGYDNYFAWFYNSWTHYRPEQAAAMEKLLREQGFLA